MESNCNDTDYALIFKIDNCERESVQNQAPGAMQVFRPKLRSLRDPFESLSDLHG